MSTSGKLVIAPTPIGNLGDMTLRSLEALREADVVCAEGTRVTGKLLAHFGIEKRLARLDEAMIGSRAAGVVERVAAGEVVAYCSDAGMPGVSDPGLRLVAAAREAGVAVEVLPWREVTVCRELTKLHEEVARGSAAELRERFAARAEEPGGVRGEIALVIDAPGETEAAAGAEEAAASAVERAVELVAEGLRTKEVTKHLVAEFGISRNDAYNLAMEAAR